MTFGGKVRAMRPRLYIDSVIEAQMIADRDFVPRSSTSSSYSRAARSLPRNMRCVR
jgi:hypothetical protein